MTELAILFVLICILFALLYMILLLIDLVDLVKIMIFEGDGLGADSNLKCFICRNHDN